MKISKYQPQLTSLVAAVEDGSLFGDYDGGARNALNGYQLQDQSYVPCGSDRHIH
jgi:hypothetical protein